MYWNPAGMTQISGMHFGFSGEMILLNGSYTAKTPIISTLRTTEVENEPATHIIPAAGIVFGGEKFAFGLSFFAPFGLGAEWDLLDTDVYNSGYPAIDLADDLKILDFHPSVAYKISDKLSVGLGVSIIRSTIELRMPKMIPNPYFTPELMGDPSLAAFYQGMTAMGALSAPFDHLINELDMEGDGWGFGGNFGIMYKPTEDLSIGLSGRYYLDQPLDGTINTTIYFMDNAMAHQTIQDNIAPILPTLVNLGVITQEQAAIMQNLYSGGTMPYITDLAVSADLPLPLNIGIGFAYTGFDNLTLSLDVDFSQWSSWDIIPFEDDNGNVVGELKEEWDDAIRIAGGLEYDLGALKLRGAFYTEPAPAPDKSLGPSIPDINTRNVGILGVSYDLGFGIVSAHFEHMFIGDRTVNEWYPPISANTAGYDNMAGTYTLNINTAMLGLDIFLDK